MLLVCHNKVFSLSLWGLCHSSLSNYPIKQPLTCDFNSYLSVCFQTNPINSSLTLVNVHNVSRNQYLFCLHSFSNLLSAFTHKPLWGRKYHLLIPCNHYLKRAHIFMNQLHCTVYCDVTVPFSFHLTSCVPF